MVGRSSELRRTLPALIASIPTTIVYFAVLGIVLTAAGPDGLDLTPGQTSGWIAVLYGFPTLIALILTLRYRQPLLVTGNIFAIIFYASLGDQVAFPSWPVQRSSPEPSSSWPPCSGSRAGSRRGSRRRSSMG